LQTISSQLGRIGLKKGPNGGKKGRWILKTPFIRPLELTSEKNTLMMPNLKIREKIPSLLFNCLDRFILDYFHCD